MNKFILGRNIKNDIDYDLGIDQKLWSSGWSLAGASIGSKIYTDIEEQLHNIIYLIGQCMEQELNENHF